MKLFGGTKSKITNNANVENLLHLEIIKVVLAHWSIVTNCHYEDPRVLYSFFPNKSFGELRIIIRYFTKILYF